MDKAALEQFLLRARAQTYAAATGKTDPLLPGSIQYEFSDGDFSYRDVYYIGNGIFPGLETVFYQDKPVWSMSYYGDFSKMTEEQVDKMLRKALIDSRHTTRMYQTIVKDYRDFVYTCKGRGTLDKLAGHEEITINDNVLYCFTYTGGLVA